MARADFGGDAVTVPHFAESGSPLAAMGRFVRPLLEEGRSLVLAGSPRDLRFLRSRIARRLKLDLFDVESWAEIISLPPGASASITMPSMPVSSTNASY